MRVSLIISTYNSPKTLHKVLAELVKGTRLPEQILIADDGSGPETVDMLQQWKAQLGDRFEHIWQEDKGFRKNRILNQALRQTSGDYVIFTDGDCVPARHFVADHAALAENGCFVQGRRAYVLEEAVPHYLAGRASLPTLFFRGQLRGAGKGLRLPWPIIRYNAGLRGLLGCNLAAWRADLLAINGYDEAYEGWGIGEDSDLCARLYNLGCKRKFVYGRALVYHLNHPQLPREHVPASRARLQQTIETRAIRCQAGIEQG